MERVDVVARQVEQTQTLEVPEGGGQLLEAVVRQVEHLQGLLRGAFGQFGQVSCDL